jgi:hypothetical protein
MDSQNPEKRQRWYDQHSTVTAAITLLETFPELIQQIIADAIMRLTERQCQVESLLEDLRSLGPEKVLGIFKAKNKCRTYDKNPIVHKAMNYLFVLSEADRVLITNQMVVLVNYIFEYLKACKASKVEADVEQATSLVNTFVEEGAETAQALLQAIQTQLRSEELLKENASGMRLREEWKP